jgi:hypothetical protein
MIGLQHRCRRLAGYGQQSSNVPAAKMQKQQKFDMKHFQEATVANESEEGFQPLSIGPNNLGRAPESASVSSRWRSFCALGLMVCIVSAVTIFPRVGRTPFHGDESDWISGGYYYTNLLRSGNFEWQKWACPECGPFGKINLQLGKWLIGIPLVLDPATRVRPYFAHYNFDETVEQNRRAGSVPTPDILFRARTAPAFFGVLCCSLVFAIGFWVYNAWVGLIAATLLLTNSLFLILTSQAMTDAFYNAFLLTVCLALVAFCKTTGKKRALLIVSLCGVLAGLACSVKITGILLGAGLFLLTALHRYRMRRSEKREIALMLAIFSLCSLATVYALDPVFWPSWQAVRVSAVFEEAGSFTGEVLTSRRLPLNHDDLAIADKRYAQLRNLANTLEFPALFLRWNRSMQRQLGRANWHGNRTLSVHRSLFSLAPPLQPSDSDGDTLNVAGVLYVVFAGVGIFFVTGKRRLAISESRDDSHIIPVVYLLVNYLLILIFLKLNWNRYYLPTTVALDLIVAAGIYGSARHGYKYLLPRLAPVFVGRKAISNAHQ